MRRVYLLVFVVLAVASVLLLYQTANASAYSRYCVVVVSSVRLVEIRFVNTSTQVLDAGFFVVAFNFDNPTAENVGLNITNIEYYGLDSQYSRFISSRNVDMKAILAPGETEFVFDVNISLHGPHALGPVGSWRVIYELGFGSINKSIVAEGYGSFVSYEVDRLLNVEGQVFDSVGFYLTAVLVVWAVGLEVLAVAFLCEPRKKLGFLRIPRRFGRKKMVFVAYLVLGFGLVSAPLYPSVVSLFVLGSFVLSWSLILDALTMSGVEGLTYSLVALSGVAYLITAFVVYLQQGTRTHAIVVSFLSVIAWFWTGVVVLATASASAHKILGVLLVLCGVANIIVYYAIPKEFGEEEARRRRTTFFFPPRPQSGAPRRG